MRGGGCREVSREGGEGVGGGGEQVQYEEEGSSLCCTCVHVTQAVADSLVFLQEFEVTYATLYILLYIFIT
jgi:hypothetical protein